MVASTSTTEDPSEALFWTSHPPSLLWVHYSMRRSSRLTEALSQTQQQQYTTLSNTRRRPPREQAATTAKTMVTTSTSTTTGTNTALHGDGNGNYKVGQRLEDGCGREWISRVTEALAKQYPCVFWIHTLATFSFSSSSLESSSERRIHSHIHSPCPLLSNVHVMQTASDPFGWRTLSPDQYYNDKKNHDDEEITKSPEFCEDKAEWKSVNLDDLSELLRAIQVRVAFLQTRFGSRHISNENRQSSSSNRSSNSSNASAGISIVIQSLTPLLCRHGGPRVEEFLYQLLSWMMMPPVVSLNQDLSGPSSGSTATASAITSEKRSSRQRHPPVLVVPVVDGLHMNHMRLHHPLGRLDRASSQSGGGGSAYLVIHGSGGNHHHGKRSSTTTVSLIRPSTGLRTQLIPRDRIGNDNESARRRVIDDDKVSRQRNRNPVDLPGGFVQYNDDGDGDGNDDDDDDDDAPRRTQPPPLPTATLDDSYDVYYDPEAVDLDDDLDL